MFLVFVVGFSLAFFLWQEYYKRTWDKNVKISLHFSNEAIYAGEHTKLIEVIENRKKFPIPLLEVGFHTKKELIFKNADNTYVSDNTYKRDIFACLGKQKITRQIDVQGKKRGYYEIDKVDFTSFSLLHERRYSKAIASDAHLYVYPSRVKVDDILVVCERMLGSLQRPKHLYEDPFAFRSIRDYMIDDPMKTINWSASARTGKLMVNTFDSVLTQKAVVFMDLEDSGILKHEHLIEYSISVAASLAYKLLLRNMELGLISNADIEFGLAGGKKQMAIIEKELALYQEDSTKRMTSMSVLLDQHSSEYEKEADSIFIFISKNMSDETKNSIVSFLGDSRQGIWICPYTMGDSKDIERVEAIKGMLHLPNLKLMPKEVAK